MDPEVLHIPLCPFRALTGWDCPACGSLRAAWDLAHLRIGEAADHNVLFVAALPLLVIVLIARRRMTPLLSPALARLVASLAIAATVGFTLVRNLPAGAWLAASA